MIPRAFTVWLLLLCGCIVYPIHKRIQPAVTLTVRDAEGRPMADVRVSLVSSAYPYGREKSRRVIQTGPDGTASFAGEREWRVESTLPHGAEVYFWNWCVEKEGFTTFFTRGSDTEMFEDPTIVLVEGVSEPCPGALR